MGRPEDALRLLETAAADALDDPELRAIQASLLSAQGRFEEAISLLQAALQRRPDAAQLYAALGPALGLAGRPAASVPALREAIRLDPTLVDAQFNLGISLQAIGQVGAARIATERVLSMRPDHLDAHVLLASLALESGDLEAAESTLNRLMNLRPDANARAMFAALQHMKGVEAEQSENCASAEGHYRAGLEVAPRYPPLLRAIRLLECLPSGGAIQPSSAAPRIAPGSPLFSSKSSVVVEAFSGDSHPSGGELFLIRSAF